MDIFIRDLKRNQKVHAIDETMLHKSKVGGGHSASHGGSKEHLHDENTKSESAEKILTMARAMMAEGQENDPS